MLLMKLMVSISKQRFCDWLMLELMITNCIMAVRLDALQLQVTKFSDTSAARQKFVADDGDPIFRGKT